MEMDSSEMHVDLDVGNLCVLNAVQLKSSLNRDLSENCLKSIAAQGAQLLVNQIFQLPSEFHEHVPVAKLPQPNTVIPREKHVPKDKPLSRWEKFAKKKGIRKTKKEKLSWDGAAKDWKPQYGYKGIRNKSDWMIEVPDNADPNIDYFGKKKEEKKERVAKNEYQRLRNIADTKNMKVTNLESVDKANKQQLARSLVAAKTSTASLGRFAAKLPKEKPPKNAMKKRKFKSNISNRMNEEKENNLKILQELSRKKPKLDIQEAVQVHMMKTERPSKKGGSKKKETKSNKKFKKNTKSFPGGKKTGFKNKTGINNKTGFKNKSGFKNKTK